MFLYVFNNIYTHHKHLKKKKKPKQSHKMIKKPFFLKNKDLHMYGTDIPKTTFVSFISYNFITPDLVPKNEFLVFGCNCFSERHKVINESTSTCLCVRCVEFHCLDF